MSTSERITLLLRVTMETGVVVALGFWGYHDGGTTAAKLGLMVAAPVLGFGFWGAVDFHQAGRLAEPLRLSQELVISAVAAVAWYAAGHRSLGIAMGALSLIYHALVYATGATLLMPKQQPTDGLFEPSAPDARRCGHPLVDHMRQTADG